MGRLNTPLLNPKRKISKLQKKYKKFENSKMITPNITTPTTPTKIKPKKKRIRKPPMSHKRGRPKKVVPPSLPPVPPSLPTPPPVPPSLSSSLPYPDNSNNNNDVKIRIELPPKVNPLLSTTARYRVLWGGRHGAKTESVARILVLKSTQRKIRILCARETQVAIKQSVHSVIKRVIQQMGLTAFFEINDTSIKNKWGSEFIFSGLSDDVIMGIKSMDSPDILWFEEASSMTWRTWDKLDPTIRSSNAELYFTLNRDKDEDPISQLFICQEPPDNAIVIEMEYWDNPWFSEEAKKQMEWMAATDFEKYLHEWEGRPVNHSVASVFKGKYIVNDFTDKINPTLWSPIYGCDLGFSIDPTVLLKAWVYEDRLYVEHEIVETNLDLDLMPDRFKTIPGSSTHIMYVDSSRPETISFLRLHGFPRALPTPKWPGSIEDGIARLRGFNKIVLHPRCEKTLYDLQNYSYKVDKQTGHILPDIVDKYSDCIDALRYAITPLVKNYKYGNKPSPDHSIILDQYGRPLSPASHLPEGYRLQQNYAAMRGNKIIR